MKIQGTSIQHTGSSYILAPNGSLTESGFRDQTSMKFMKITESAEIHIYMPKGNITQELKTSWMNKLSNINPKIKFEIRALEDFIN